MLSSARSSLSDGRASGFQATTSFEDQPSTSREGGDLNGWWPQSTLPTFDLHASGVCVWREQRDGSPARTTCSKSRCFASGRVSSEGASFVAVACTDPDGRCRRRWESAVELVEFILDFSRMPRDPPRRHVERCHWSEARECGEGRVSETSTRCAAWETSVRGFKTRRQGAWKKVVADGAWDSNAANFLLRRWFHGRAAEHGREGGGIGVAFEGPL
mmetsp:Transcript_50324/g.133628  ORF Transcript_50324/g.133628 Transcript_50324/m.133628 type:complete len:216 (+) Transcript_50324:2083-2730(+)